MYRPLVLPGVAAEALAGLMLWLSAGGEEWVTNVTIFAAVVFHTVSSYFLARAFWQLLPRRYKLPARRSLSFLFALLWMLPVLGALGVLWSVTSALQRPHGRSSRSVKSVLLPELPFSPPVIYETPPYSEGALRQIVYFAARPLKRLKAVMATRHMQPREAMAVWSKATRDPVDDVRLFAYAMLDNSEKKLISRILALTEVLPAIPLRAQRACHKAIAALCWELVYQRLVQGAVRQHWLQTARRHIEFVLFPSASAPSSRSDASTFTASKDLPVLVVRDPDSLLLYGRILLESGEFVLAREAFASARSAGMSQQKILPWLAEIAFRERQFSEVKRCLSALARPGEKGRELSLVKAWWNK
ncbi:MAG: protein PelE [Nitrosospira sp.]|nr:protein PelE [Nitrosospira sp.]